MGPVTNFLLRWLYVQSLIDEKTLITAPHANAYPQPSSQYSQYDTTNDSNPFHQYKVNCKQALLLYRPGYDRLRALDSERLSCVSTLFQQLVEADQIVKNFRFQSSMQNEIEDVESIDLPENMDADIDALRTWKNITRSRTLFNSSSAPINIECNFEEFQKAKMLLEESREYLPQLISVLLHSTSALTPNGDPIQAFRSMILHRCLEDPNMGIELCWLLEAEVGRAWKTLFEHKDRTGRRLIVVLPHDKARVMAQIGSEKRYAFDLLQDSEMATAFGCIPSSHTLAGNNFVPQTSRLPASISELRCTYYGDTMHFIDKLTQVSLDLRMVPILQRKSFMQDRLRDINRRIRRRMYTKGRRSLDEEDGLGPDDFPQVSDILPTMITHSVHLPLVPKIPSWQGRVDESINIVTDAIKDKKSFARKEDSVVRVLNIVTSECRLLASRDRCPFLVLLEVADTYKDRNDANLYSHGGSKGLTLSESLGMGLSHDTFQRSHFGEKFSPITLPRDLLSRKFEEVFSTKMLQKTDDTIFNEITSPMSQNVFIMRGGWQDDGFYYQGNAYNPEYDFLYQNQLNEYHRQQQQQQHHHFQLTQQYPHNSNADHQSPPPPPFDMQQRQAFPAETHMKLLSSDLLDHIFGQEWKKKCETVRQNSPFRDVRGWRLAAFIMKAGEDIRKEALVMQIISKLNDWFEQDMPIFRRPLLRPYTIMCVGEDAGLIECLSNSKSVDEIKKECPGYTSLKDYFDRAYSVPVPNVQSSAHQGFSETHSFPSNQVREAQISNQEGTKLSEVTLEKARDNFMKSLVGYSLISYILQIKDRHNANILLDRTGTLIHIDFGFVLGETPKMGKVPIFNERAPFKLTPEFWDVIGGWNIKEGGKGAHFCAMFEAAFACASNHADEIASIVEATYLNLSRSRSHSRYLAEGIRERLRMRGPPGSPAQKEFIMDLVNTALTSWGTSTYDWLQKTMNGYEM